MKLKTLNLTRAEWGNDKGLLTGTITLAGTETETKLRLNETMAAKIVALVAEGIKEEAARLSNIMTGELMEAQQQALLGAPELDEVDDEI